jgi:cell division protein FtsI/penicillin-binding protein 2
VVWSAAVAVGLFASLPELARGAVDAPRVDLGALKVTDDGVTAPLTEGGVAELTLDVDLQRTATALLTEAHPVTGAVVALDVARGRVLAWAGSRGGSAAPDVVANAIAPAASVFKLVTTTALLEKGVKPDRVVCVSGGSSGISREHLYRPKTGHALCAPFHDALGRSRNAVFAQLATRFLNREDLLGFASRLGFGHDVPFDVPITVGTLEVPDGDLEFARAASGFVGSRLSVAGGALLASTIASRGVMKRLRIVQSAPGYEAPHHAEVVGHAMHESTARELTHMMEGTIGGGTCLEAFTDPSGQSYLRDVRVAGKTGTLKLGEETTSSWFLGFAPSRHPRIVVSVLLENGATWRRKANEVGRDVLRAYFAARGSRGVTAPDLSGVTPKVAER